MFKKIIAALLCVSMLACCCIIASATGDTSDNTLKIINFNVDGLPIPSSISSTGKNTWNTTKAIGDLLSAENADIIGVQEDFEFHFLLKNRVDLPYKTYSNGGTGTGDGLNFFSAYELFNVGRVEWNEAYGVFDAGSDKLTPKGILYATIELAEGAYVDIYDIHVDAFDDEGSTAAKLSQYAQLKELVDSHSAGRAVIIMGDTNVYFTMASGQVLKETFIGSGFKDAWVEAVNDGDYDYTVEEGYEKYKLPQWGNWDSVEKVMYRSSDAVTLTAESSEYRAMYAPDGMLCSDHNAQIVTLSFEINEEAAAASVTSLKEYKYDLGYQISSFITNFYDAIVNILKELPRLISGEVGIDFVK